MEDLGWLRAHIRDIADFPKPGITFKDITPLLGDAAAFAATLDGLATPFAGSGIDKVLGIEARGFIFGAGVADRLSSGFVPVRKQGRLPGPASGEGYALEYGTDLLEVHDDAFGPGDTVLIVDDVLATGGTAAAVVRLAERLGARVAGVAVALELGFLDGRAALAGHRTHSLLTYEA